MVDNEGYEEKIQEILIWAEDHGEFDDGFVRDLDSKVKAGRRLSEAQKNAIDNIYEKFRIGD